MISGDDHNINRSDNIFGENQMTNTSESYETFKCFVEFYDTKTNRYMKFKVLVDRCLSERQKYNAICDKWQQISGEKLSRKCTFKVNP